MRPYPPPTGRRCTRCKEFLPFARSGRTCACRAVGIRGVGRVVRSGRGSGGRSTRSTKLSRRVVPRQRQCVECGRSFPANDALSSRFDSQCRECRAAGSRRWVRSTLPFCGRITSGVAPSTRNGCGRRGSGRAVSAGRRSRAARTGWCVRDVVRIGGMRGCIRKQVRLKQRRKDARRREAEAA